MQDRRCHINFENGSSVSCVDMPVPPFITSLVGCVSRLRDRLVEEGRLPAEPTFNEGTGIYLQLGLQGMAHDMHVTPTHYMRGGSLKTVPPPSDTPPFTAAWVNENMDVHLSLVGQVMYRAVHVHMLTAQLDAAGPNCGATSLAGASLFHWAALALGVPPEQVMSPLAITYRGLTDWLPAHTDPDLDSMIAHYYLTALHQPFPPPALPLPRCLGCELFVASERMGGQVVSVDTEPQPGRLKMVAFSPAAHLHWVESAESATGWQEGMVRGIPFNNRWLAGVLSSDKGGYVRMAPLSPRPRPVWTCSRCSRLIGCPKADASYWLHHFCRAVRAAADLVPCNVCVECL